MPSNSDYRIRVLDTTAAFDAAREQWQALEREVDHFNVSASYNWLRTWWEVFATREDNFFGYAKKLRILLVLRNGVLVAVAPLVRLYRKKHFLKVSYVEFLGQQWGATTTDFVARPSCPGLADAVFGWLWKNERFNVLRLSRIPEHSTVLSPQDKHMFLLSACPILYASRYVDYESYRKALHSKNFRKHLRRSLKKLKERGLTYEYKAVPATSECMADIAHLSKSKLVDGKRSLYLDEDKSLFMTKMVERFPCHIDLLRIDDRNVAYRLCVHFGGGVFAFDTSYDREHRDLGLGHLIYLLSIQHFLTERRFSFHCGGPGLQPHKSNHYPEVVKTYTYLRAGNTVLGKLIRARMQTQLAKVEKRTLAELSDHHDD